MGSYIWQLVIILFCLVMSAYFSATETAFSTLNRIRIKNLAEDGNKRAKKVMGMVDDFDTMLSTVLVGNNIVNILSSAIATVLFIGLLKNNDLGTTVSTVVMTIVVLLFGEISPKSIAKKYPERFAMFSAPILQFISIILFPLTKLFGLWQAMLTRIFKSGDDTGMTEDELISIIEVAEEEGDLGEAETTLIKSAIEFNDLEVGDIFTPRRDVVAVSENAAQEEVAEIFTESGYSRIPVYRDSIDDIVGIVYYKDFYSTAFGKDVPLSEIMKPVLYVTRTQHINDLMKELQKKQLHMAIVMDEFGAMSGIVTLEDIIEEIVGEIWDEHDEIVEEIKQIGENEYIISGKANVSKVFDLFDIDDEETDAQTMGGWAMDVLGKIPEIGDTFESDGLSAEILDMDDKRVDHLRIVYLGTEDEEEEEDSKHSRRRESDDEEEES